MFDPLFQFAVALEYEFSQGLALVKVAQVGNIGVLPIFGVTVLVTFEVEFVIQPQLLEALFQFLCGAISILVVRWVNQKPLLTWPVKVLRAIIDVDLIFLVESHFPALSLYAAIFLFDDLLLLKVERGLEGEGFDGGLEGGEVDDCIVPLGQ